MSLERVNEFVTVNKYTSEEEEGTVYHAELQHAGLKEHKLISAAERPILVDKLRRQMDAWEEQWLVKQGLKAPEEAFFSARYGVSEAERQDKIRKAEQQSYVAQKKIDEIAQLLLLAFQEVPIVDWDTMKVNEEYTEIPPEQPLAPQLMGYPREPDFQDEEFSPKLTLIDKVIQPFKTKKEDKAYKSFQLSYKRWREVCKDIDKENAVTNDKYAQALKRWEKEMESWKASKDKFYQDQQEINDTVDQLKKDYELKAPDAILQYCKMVLQNDRYPETFPQDFTLEYSQHDQTLMLEYAMPSIHDMPILKAVEYDVEKDKLSKTYLDEKEREVLYENALYHITLRVLYALFQSDLSAAIERIHFNGWVVSSTHTIGPKEKQCILSLHTSKDAFMANELSQIDPESYFRQLGGVTHAQLSRLAPDDDLAALESEDHQAEVEEEEKEKEMEVEKEVEPQHIGKGEDEGDEEEAFSNLMTMESEDFRHCIRAMLEKEFNPYGGEVNIMQSGRKEEIHAIVFDPDPIRGGRIFIHGKRSMHPIGVWEVRELFGNVMKEGASKGILITTSDFEAEARDFAREKPLSLLDGTALLFLLEKHGLKFRIDFHEAGKV